MQQKPRTYTDMPTPDKTAAIIGWLEDRKALDLLALDISSLSAFTDAVIIVSATSVRHAQGLADHVLDSCKKEHFEFLRMEGYQTGQWILLDCNDIVINIFTQENRDLYRLEELWPTARVIRDDRAAS